MAKRNRSTLKNYFRKGALPSSEHFSDLIDSSLNTLDEGFDKTQSEGFKVSSLGESASLMSFYREEGNGSTLWSIRFDDATDSLLFQPSAHNPLETQVDKPSQQSIFSLTQEGHVGINRTSPAQCLDVNGIVKAKGRMGGLFDEESHHLPYIKADGHWYNITPLLEGCQAFEIMAGVGIKRSGRYGLLHAIALNTCNPNASWFSRWFNLFNWKKQIHAYHAFYGSRADKVKLRWIEVKANDNDHGAYRPYYLQMRSNTRYGEGMVIRYHMTRLWFDEYMADSQLPVDGSQ
ncbi:hypothetical protein [Shewanella surugensis]|uniref:Adhesin n=1 Tax=Shewanella surugensis TaxID=212020 RepID=A0ABT0L7W5_9GAMM|nr:hypothetical protein [Shewanella surugensis]MCL1123740.1 hypothetical protein [Shewanella surugensis]